MAAEDDRRSGLDPEGFERRLSQYLEWMRVHHYAESTTLERTKRMGRFIAWCAERGLTRPSELTRPILERYQSWIFYVRKADGQPLSVVSQVNHLSNLKCFFQWLARQNHILSNPASDLVPPRLPRRLPKVILTAEEVERVLAIPDVSTPLGLRDRAILETLYSTGVRRMELVGLAAYDVDPNRGTLHVRQGKGGHPRIVPIGSRALAWVQKYIEDVRPSLIVPPDEGTLFLSVYGKALLPNSLGDTVRWYMRHADIGKTGSAHLFRHTMATLMMENGADLRYVQEILGHAQLKTTEIYTHVSICKLKAVHDATHPASRIAGPRAHRDGSAPSDAEAATPPVAEAATPPVAEAATPRVAEAAAPPVAEAATPRDADDGEDVPGQAPGP